MRDTLRVFILGGLLCVSSALALGQTATANQPDVSILISEQQLRFVAPPAVSALRLQIHSPLGELLFDSGSQLGGTLNWNLRDHNGLALAGGLYRYTLSSLSNDGTVNTMRQGNLILEQNGERLWLTTKDDSPIGTDVQGGELAVARAGGRTIAGGRTVGSESNSKRALNGRDVEDEKGNKLFSAKGQTDKLVAAILGTPGRIVKFGAGGAADADSLMSESGAVITTAGSQNVTGSYLVNGLNGLRVDGPQQGLFIGDSAGNVSTGQNNAFIGKNAGLVNTTGNHNVFLGVGAGQKNIGGFSNMFIGPFAGGNNTTGVGNTFIGASAGDKNDTASNNVAIGSSANVANVSGGDNVAIGASAGLANTAGQNVFIGGFAGKSNTNGSSNTFVGINTDGATALTNATAIGAKAFVNASNALVLGSINGVNGATASTNVGIGTTTPVARLEVVGDIRSSALRQELTTYTPNVINGYVGVCCGSSLPGNRVTSGVFGAAIGGGGFQGSLNTPNVTLNGDFSNQVTDAFGTISGGLSNRAGNNDTSPDNATYTTIGGGFSNVAGIANATVGGGAFNNANAGVATIGGGAFNNVGGLYGTIGGGGNNTVLGDLSTVSGGGQNNADGLAAAVGGGNFNSAVGNYATVSGGYSNRAEGTYSTAAGRRAKALHFGSFVWGDGTDADVATTANNQYLIRATGGVGIGTSSPADQLHVAGEARVNSCVKNSGGTAIAGTCASDRRYKRNITAFPSMLQQVARLQPVHYFWRSNEFPAQHFDNQQSYGLVAQDVEAILPELVVTNTDGYKAVNYSKLPLVTLQAVKELKAENDLLKQRLAAIEKLLKRQPRRSRR